MRKAWLVLLLVTFVLVLPVYSMTMKGNALVMEGRKAEKLGYYAEAFKDYKKACELGDGDGCFYLGVLYDQGWGVKKTIL